MKPNEYIPEVYWDKVAGEIQIRTGDKLIAGDNDPFYKYKRSKFLRLLSSIPFANKKVIEIGPGPGGNLLEIFKQNPSQLIGADISSRMLQLCRENIGNKNIELIKINGYDLPFPNTHVDITITSTLLQHITDETVLSTLVNSICRITSHDVFIFERIEKKYTPDPSNTGRTIDEYRHLFENNGWKYRDRHFLNIYWSQLACGIIRRTFNTRRRKEGEQQTNTSLFLQRALLHITRRLDQWFPVKKDLALLHFSRTTS